ncbi:signal transduction histidine kinase [Sorangium cellulosum]|uniref:histidine kinase n=1 Tax=Sorangium cellulosum TaxID=56 RepID=A0A2L0EL72_SORCE|nr:ATP-binding protein [Sorangium cellulosum]AUX40049.1 signal transduction histidine kinase [Sorangium cellulosum]
MADFDEGGRGGPGEAGGIDRSGELDLSSCAREPIHIPGSIQPHGVLFALKEPELTIVQVSSNTADLLGIQPLSLLGEAIFSLLDRASVCCLRGVVAGGVARGKSPLPVTVAGARFDGVLHRSGGLLVLEIEPSQPEECCDNLLERTFAIVERLRAAPTVAELCQRAAEEIGRLTSFDRTMVYRFHGDDHGEVIAESCAPGMESYLHLHYPASDIPEQARRLYTINRTRHIVDVDYPPAAILPPDNPLTGEPLDLSSSVLRSVSPVHLQYLRNMGVRASMSVSLLRGGALSGLIACHHRSPHRVSFRQRMACELLGQIFAWKLETREQRACAEARLRASAVRARLLEQMTSRRDIAGGLSAGPTTVLDLIDAGGAAICQEGRWTRLGETPDAADLDALGRWLETHSAETTYATECLPAEQPGLEHVKDVASGVLAILFSGAPCSVVAWFRPEVEKSVVWAGDPGKGCPPGGEPLLPRASFAAWRQLVRLRSSPWEPCDVAAAEDLRDAIVGVVLSRASELDRLNRELQEAVRVRDDFLSMASHELRTPLFTLALQIDGLARAAGGRRDAPAPERLLSRIDVARRQVKRLEQLVGGLLDFSRISAGKLALDLQEVSLAGLLRDVEARFSDDLKAAGCKLSVRLDGCEDVVGRWDPMRLDQVLTNLLSNAIKYGAGAPIEIEAARRGDHVRVAVIDHGIGIDPDAQARIFERFERAVSSGHYSGFGLGLWIVHHIVERLGGAIRVSSAPGQGATFTVELPLAGPGPGAPASLEPPRAGGGAGNA